MKIWHEENGDEVPSGITHVSSMIEAMGTASIDALFPGDIIVEPDRLARLMTTGNPDEYIKSQVGIDISNCS